jgi:hypothetical protein
MKFSSTSAHEYISNLWIRNKFSDLHIGSLKKRLLGDEQFIFPDGFCELVESSGCDIKDATKWKPELLDFLFAEPRMVMTDISNLSVFVIRKTVQDICSRINIKEDKKFDYLKKAKDGNRVLVLDESRFFKYYKKGSRIVVTYFQKGAVSFEYCMFNFELNKEYTNQHENQMMADATKLFLQLILFMEFAPFESVFLKPSEKNGTRSEGKVLNDSPTNLIIVDSSWNKIVIRTEGFTVGADTMGFLALRAYGEGRLHRRFVWIDPYEKKGYVRGLKSLISE